MLDHDNLTLDIPDPAVPDAPAGPNKRRRNIVLAIAGSIVACIMLCFAALALSPPADAEPGAERSLAATLDLDEVEKLAETNTPQPTATEEEPSATPIETNTPTATATNTRQATATPRPTNTPRPTATPTIAPTATNIPPTAVPTQPPAPTAAPTQPPPPPATAHCHGRAHSATTDHQH